MSKPKTLIKKLGKYISTRIAIWKLTLAGGQLTLAVARALNRTVMESTNREETIFLRKIEELRQKMSFLDSPVTEIKVYDKEKREINLGTIKEICHKASIKPFWGLALFMLTREIKPNICFELGTCLGISAAYQAAALNLNDNGQLITLESKSSLARLAEDNLGNLGIERIKVLPGRVQEILSTALVEYQPVDYVFVDCNHDEQSTIDFFNQIFPFLSASAIMIFDDINWSEEMKRAWIIISNDERVNISVTMSRIGICIFDKSVKRKKHIRV